MAQSSGGHLKPDSKRATAQHWPYPGERMASVSPPGWHVSPFPSLELKEGMLPLCQRELSVKYGE